MGDKKQPTTREKIVLEYLVGGVTYRQLEAKWGVDHATIQRWVLQHKGLPRKRTDSHPTQKSTIKVLPPPQPPLPLPVDQEKVRLEKQLLEAQRKILLLQEAITIAQADHGFVLPKKFTTKPSKLLGNEKK